MCTHVPYAPTTFEGATYQASHVCHSSKASQTIMKQDKHAAATPCNLAPPFLFHLSCCRAHIPTRISPSTHPPNIPRSKFLDPTTSRSKTPKTSDVSSQLCFMRTSPLIRPDHPPRWGRCAPSSCGLTPIACNTWPVPVEDEKRWVADTYDVGDIRRCRACCGKDQPLTSFCRFVKQVLGLG